MLSNNKRNGIEKYFCNFVMILKKSNRLPRAFAFENERKNLGKRKKMKVVITVQPRKKIYL